MTYAPPKPGLIDLHLELGGWSRAEARTRSRHLRDRVLTDLAGWSFDESHVIRDAYGRPTCPLLPEVCWSASSCDGAAAIAVTNGCRVGFDIERIDPASLRAPGASAAHPCDAIDESLLRLTLTERELALWRQTPEPLLFFQIWTRKEAVLKCLGCGLHTEPCLVETGRPSDAWTRATAGALSCLVRSLEVADGLAAAIACEEPRELRQL
ncbi:MAG: 4'-phosphopantetheinyl transferase superfamily protein [Phycisphaerales bacterium]|nr:4'-phosphopantetheinyl transferase superfamily protein [Phycisphaerales bacterium]